MTSPAHDRRGPAVAFDNIVKSFGPVEVLHGVSFALEPGRVYGLLGENGAGESTLMKILAGYEAPSGGSVLINGEAVSFRSSRDAEARGIVLIHQEFNLAEDLTIAGNIFLGHEKKKGWLLDEGAMQEGALAAMRQVGLDIDPATPVRRLIVAEKQLVEIAKAVARRARLLIMDEPTATLTPSEAARLFALIARMRADGVTVIYISHKLDEVERITDEVIVMRDGRFVGRAPTETMTRHAMANMMVGREIADQFPPRLVVDESCAPALRVRDVSVSGWAHDASFEVRPGEILGFAGLVGAGRTELFEGILGLRPASGTIELEEAGGEAPLAARRSETRAHLSERGPQGQRPACRFPARPEPHPDGARTVRETVARSGGGETGAQARRRRIRNTDRIALGDGLVIVGRQPAEARARQGAPPGTEGRRARRADARRRCRRQARNLFPDPPAGPAGPCGGRHLVGADRTDRPAHTGSPSCAQAGSSRCSRARTSPKKP